jgi:hypothetical protein
MLTEAATAAADIAGGWHGLALAADTAAERPLVGSEAAVVAPCAVAVADSTAVAVVDSTAAAVAPTVVAGDTGKLKDLR